jgi:hypothetical protein
MIKFWGNFFLLGVMLMNSGCAPFVTIYPVTTEIVTVERGGVNFYEISKNIKYANNDFVFFVQEKDCGNVDATLDVKVIGSNGVILEKFVDLRELSWAKAGNEGTCVPAGFFSAKKGGDFRPLFFRINKGDGVVKFIINLNNKKAIPIRIAIDSSS